MIKWHLAAFLIIIDRRKHALFRRENFLIDKNFPSQMYMFKEHQFKPTSDRAATLSPNVYRRYG